MEYVFSTWQDGSQLITINTPFHFKMGGILPRLQLAYQTYGTLNHQKSNVILIYHILSKSQNLGWWNDIVGEGKPIDTRQFYVICINNIGSCFGSSGPTSLNEITGRPYQKDFPFVCFADVVRSQQLLLEALEIPFIYAVIGPSMGGMAALEWAAAYPESWKKMLLISTPCRSYPFNIFNRAIQRDIINSDPEWKNGYYDHNPVNTLTRARMASQLFYRGFDEINLRFLNQTNSNSMHIHQNEHFEIYNYQKYNAQKFANYFDTNAYYYALNMMDYFDVTQAFQDKRSIFSPATHETLLITVETDLLYPLPHQLEVYDLLESSNIKVVRQHHITEYGHDAFLIDTNSIGDYFHSFLCT